MRARGDTAAVIHWALSKKTRELKHSSPVAAAFKDLATKDEPSGGYAPLFSHSLGILLLLLLLPESLQFFGLAKRFGYSSCVHKQATGCKYCLQAKSRRRQRHKHRHGYNTTSADSSAACAVLLMLLLLLNVAATPHQTEHGHYSISGLGARFIRVHLTARSTSSVCRSALFHGRRRYRRDCLWVSSGQPPHAVGQPGHLDCCCSILSDSDLGRETRPRYSTEAWAGDTSYWSTDRPTHAARHDTCCVHCFAALWAFGLRRRASTKRGGITLTVQPQDVRRTQIVFVATSEHYQRWCRTHADRGVFRNAYEK